MNRKTFLSSILGIAVTPHILMGCNETEGGSTPGDPTRYHEVSSFDSFHLSDDEWREILPLESYRVLREEATERPFSSELNDEHRDGTFICRACHLPLFSSDTKFDSGTGWPSFWAAYEECVGTALDSRLARPRTEYHCKRCEGHQGHIFEDGPEPTGKRWCNNGVALLFVSADDPLPDLRV